MKYVNIRKWTGFLIAGIAGLLGLAATSFAADFYLVAKEFTKTMPDGQMITMWGFATDADSDLGTDGGETAISPGPVLEVPQGDSVLNIHLRNDLGVDVSLVIPGQNAVLSPVSFIDGQGRERVTSFTEVTAPGSVGIYSWNGVKPGTYIYQSGTHPAVQVQMGLYGALKKDAAHLIAYNSQPNIDASYDNEVILFYSEIDPALHAAVAGGTYGTAAYPSTIDYHPAYFLINGEPYPGAMPLEKAGLQPGQKVLIRFLSASLDTHVPQLVGPYMQVIAEDGNPYPYAREQYSVLLAAGKTTDALVVFTGTGDYPIFDRRLSLTNDMLPAGGMLVSLGVNVCFGDFDGDGDVDLSDFIVFRGEYGRTDCDPQLSSCQGDFDGDGDVDLSDFIQFRSNYGRTDCLN